ncbi:hypothetical protein [Roseomonas sp. CECT 9278]|uniref:hypothetical protein n=1 Tax=Roseomonas sp. CECT 9278 TaxID=2845823 RepID=UPI001E446F5F|nr:hypothetical protein [Roseomonas sp. CECT 9278]
MPLTAARRGALLANVAAQLLVPALAARFGAPRAGTWRSDAAALAGTLADGTLADGIAALAALNPDGHMFRPICRDIILPAADALRRRYDPTEFDQTERLAKVWQLRMCLLSLDDAEVPGSGEPASMNTALTLSGALDMPSVEHGVALRFFDRAGWDVCDVPSHGAEEARDSAHDRTFDVAWISIEPGAQEADIRATVEGLRRASRNAAILVLGGGLPGQVPGDASALALDGFTGSAIEAAVISETALRLRRAGLRD